MTLKKSLALTIIIVLILVLEGCVVLADRRPVDPYNHTLGDTLFAFIYSNFIVHRKPPARPGVQPRLCL